MKLHELAAVPGSTQNAKRIGRGHGSGWGKTAGKGHKGQKARAGTVVDTQALIDAGIVKTCCDGVKVLSNGKLEKKLTVKVNAFSEGAKQKIEAAGGKAEVI